MVTRFEKFSKRAHRVLTLAQEEAECFNHDYVDAEHILLGISRVPQGVAARALSNLGVKPADVRAAIEPSINPGEKRNEGKIALTPRARKVVQLAAEEAHRGNSTYIGTEHLLIGILMEGEGAAAEALQGMGITEDKARAQADYVIERW